MQAWQITSALWLAVICYLIACLRQFLNPNIIDSLSRPSYYGLIILGLGSHAACLLMLIYTGEGQNLSQSNVVSLTCWLSLLLVSLLQIRVVWFRLISMLLLPLTAASALVAVKVHDSRIIETTGHIVVSLHVVFGLLILALALLVLLQALLALIQHRQLKGKQMFGWLTQMPPLQLTENLLLQSVKGLFLLVSLMLLLSLVPLSGGLGSAPLSWWFGGTAWLLFGWVWYAFRGRLMSTVQASAVTIIAVALLLAA